MIVFIATLVCLVAASDDSTAAGVGRFVATSPGATFDTTEFRPLEFSTTPPPTLVEAAKYRGKDRRYASLTLGSPGSTLVAVALVAGEGTDPGVYVDIDRNGEITDAELVPLAGRGGRVKLTVELTREGAAPERLPREFALRYSRASRSLQIAATGYWEGTVDIDGHKTTYRRQDGNANGTFADQDDLLWLDLNGDGKWNPLDEQFAYRPISTIAGKRFAVRGNARGNQLSIDSHVATGTVALRWRSPLPEAKVAWLEVLLVGRDGSVASARLDRPEEIPAGEYRIAAVSVGIAAAEGEPAWRFEFADRGLTGARTIIVPVGGAVDLDPIGELVMRPRTTDEMVAPPGKEMIMRLGVFTQDNLELSTAERGPNRSYLRETDMVRGEVTTLAGKRLDTFSSGFA